MLDVGSSNATITGTMLSSVTRFAVTLMFAATTSGGRMRRPRPNARAGFSLVSSTATVQSTPRSTPPTTLMIDDGLPVPLRRDIPPKNERNTGNPSAT